MHEVSIAGSLLDMAVEECRKNGFSVVKHIKVSIGKASGVMPEALLFAFDAMKGETIAAGAVLQIEEIPLSGRCDSCGSAFTTEESYVLCCPSCGSHTYVLLAGRELNITELEVD